MATGLVKRPFKSPNSATALKQLCRSIAHQIFRSVKQSIRVSLSCPQNARNYGNHCSTYQTKIRIQSSHHFLNFILDTLSWLIQGDSTGLCHIINNSSFQESSFFNNLLQLHPKTPAQFLEIPSGEPSISGMKTVSMERKRYRAA